MSNPSAKIIMAIVAMVMALLVLVYWAYANGDARGQGRERPSLVVATPEHDVTFVTIGTLANLCGFGTRQAQDKFACEAYISAVVDSLIVVQVMYPDKVEVCPEVYQGAPVGMKLQPLIHELLEIKPEIDLSMSAAFGVMLAMQHGYPCGDSRDRG